MYENTKLILDSTQITPGKVAWRCPSNLAIVKYWGKHGVQLPRNSSISFTLNEAFTETSLSYGKRVSAPKNDIELEFYFDGEANEAFRTKLLKFLSGMTSFFPFLEQMHLRIDSMNSFPHSAGIASSASSMAALALCLCSMEQDLFGGLGDESKFLEKASYIARLGSGSASRSVYPGLAVWGTHNSIEEASDEYAVPYQAHEVFHSFHDDIMIISKGEKSVSSTAGHALMEGNPYADLRYDQARIALRDLDVALQKGDIETFGRIAEAEALSLHALMMTSRPSYILMEGNSLEGIKRIRNWRAKTGLPLYFSLDAGPNLHLLYPDSIATEAKAFINAELRELCAGGEIIEDVVGKGPKRLV